MKILHLYSDWKWTGPAEPAIQACRSLMDCGHEVLFACPESNVKYDEKVGEKAEALGLNVTYELGLNRYFKLGPTLHDLHALPRLLRREQFDIIHCHLSHDHAFAGAFSRLPGTGEAKVVRSLYKRSVLPDRFGTRFLLRHMTDGCVAFTESFRKEYIRRFKLAPETVGISPMSIDVDRFSPDKPRKDMRKEFGIETDAPLIGIVGRWQKYRRAEVFVEAARRLLQDIPQAKFLIIGRSSQMKETVIKPINDLGISESVVLSGYRREDYADTLACLNIFSLIMPGFDGTARAVREALALGKPCVVSKYGMLPEVVRDGSTGYCVPIDAAALADSWKKLIQNPDVYAEMSKNAVADALERFQVNQVGPVLTELYSAIVQS